MRALTEIKTTWAFKPNSGGDFAKFSSEGGHNFSKQNFTFPQSGTR